MFISKFMLKMTMLLLAVVMFSVPMTAEKCYSQDDIKTTLFKEADQAKQAADDSKADLLAPKNYSKAMDYYNDAKDDLKKG